MDNPEHLIDSLVADVMADRALTTIRKERDPETRVNRANIMIDKLENLMERANERRTPQSNG